MKTYKDCIYSIAKALDLSIEEIEKFHKSVPISIESINEFASAFGRLPNSLEMQAIRSGGLNMLITAHRQYLLLNTRL